MKKKRILGLLTLTTIAALTLAACGSGGGDKGKEGGNASVETEDASLFEIKTADKEDAIEGGTLDVGIVTDSQFKGMFMWELYQDAYDADFMSPSHEALFTSDGDFALTNDGPFGVVVDEEAKTATVTRNKDVKWSDGEPVTMEDLQYSYEIIGHPDYTGIRYDSKFMKIAGMEDYHSGKADTISGIKIVDDKTLTIEYTEVDPGLLQGGGGVYSYAAPKHVLEGIAIKDLESSDAVRKNPVSFGPYYMSKIVPGESVEYLPNEHYYGEKPKLDKIIMTSVPPASSVEALNSKQYDVMLKMPTDTYPTYKDVEGYEILGREEQSYTYIGFKLGKWEGDGVVTDPNAKMANKSLRQAMGYAIDNDQVGDKFYNGLRSNASTLIPPIFKSFHNEDAVGYSSDPEKAKALLDEAGYKDTDDDGFVEDPEGKPLVIKFASMSGGETAQPLADYYVQKWEEIGLKVELSTGRLIDFQAFYDKLENDDPEIDVYQGAWGTGSNPSPQGLYGKNSAYNYTRFSSDENTKLLDAIDSQESFDPEFRKNAFDEWQEYAIDEAFVIPTLYRNETLPVSERVVGWDWSYDNPLNTWATVGVSKEAR